MIILMASIAATGRKGAVAAASLQDGEQPIYAEGQLVVTENLKPEQRRAAAALATEGAQQGAHVGACRAAALYHHVM